jgi:hypothetical protein
MKKLRYRFIEGEPGTDQVGQGYWEGYYTLTTWTEGATVFKGNVTSDFTWPSSGEVVWNDTTAPALGTITMTPLVATVATQWTGTVSGVSDMSELSASAPGSTGLVVAGNTIKATWATAGSKTLTVTETNPRPPTAPRPRPSPSSS